MAEMVIEPVTGPNVQINDASLAKGGAVDPEVQIPEAVRKRSERINALYQSTSPAAIAAAENGNPQPAPVEPAPPPPPPPPPPEPQPAQPPAATLDGNPQEWTEPPSHLNWKNRFSAMSGRYDNAQRTIGEMQAQMQQMGAELMSAQQRLQQQQPSRQPQPQPQPQPEYEPQPYLYESDRQAYGDELIDFSARAAMHTVEPRLVQIERQNAELRQRLDQEALRLCTQQLELAVPNWREIDRNPRWHAWLKGMDILSGRVRQQLLNEAKAAASAPRVISFFRAFLQEEQATGHLEPTQSSPPATPPRAPAVPLASLAAPGRARPATGGETSVTPYSRTYTRPEIAQLYAQHRRGAYVGREAEWARLEQDMIRAPLEGRIR